MAKLLMSQCNDVFVAIRELKKKKEYMLVYVMLAWSFELGTQFSKC